MVLLFLNKTIRGLNCLFFDVVVAIFKDMGGGQLRDRVNKTKVMQFHGFV